MIKKCKQCGEEMRLQGGRKYRPVATPSARLRAKCIQHLQSVHGLKDFTRRKGFKLEDHFA